MGDSIERKAERLRLERQAKAANTLPAKAKAVTAAVVKAVVKK